MLKFNLHSVVIIHIQNILVAKHWLWEASLNGDIYDRKHHPGKWDRLNLGWMFSPSFYKELSREQKHWYRGNIGYWCTSILQFDSREQMDGVAIKVVGGREKRRDSMIQSCNRVRNKGKRIGGKLFSTTT